MIIETQSAPTTLQGIASLVGALVWPILVGTLVFCYRKTIRSILPILVDKFRTAESVELPGLKIAQAKIDIQEAVSLAPVDAPVDRVPESQLRRAQSLDIKLTSAGISPDQTAALVENQVVELANEYQTVRSSMSAGASRTLAMDQIMAKMRTLGLRMLPLLEKMALSRQPGERLAAIAALQVQPDARFLRWLTERLYVEVPFLFSHASLALSEFVKKFGLSTVLREDLEAALEQINKHPYPDQNTVRILRQILGQ